MAITVETDPGSGFCGGVIRAIGKAEDFLQRQPRLYSLGAIVHNEAELERLSAKGLVTIGRAELERTAGAPPAAEATERPAAGNGTPGSPAEAAGAGRTLLIRAHGEPPETYAEARAAGFALIDCTCPVVLQLQKRIREAYARLHQNGRRGQILIFGKIGHAEVLGLVGQVNGDALVVENEAMLEAALQQGALSLQEPIEIFSQTTKSPAEYAALCATLEAALARAHPTDSAQPTGSAHPVDTASETSTTHEICADHLTSTAHETGTEHSASAAPVRAAGLLRIHNTICSEVASRHEKLSAFAKSHDILLFVSGRSSSNGKVLCDLCKSVNPRTYHIGSPAELRRSWFRPDDRAGICGATSTPQWLLEQVAAAVLALN